MQPPDNLFQSEGLSVDNAGKLAWNRFCTPQTSRQPLSARQQKLAEKAERFHLKLEVQTLHTIDGNQYLMSQAIRKVNEYYLFTVGMAMPSVLWL